MRSVILVFMLLAVFLAGCGSDISVNYDYDIDAPFSEYKSYAWIERDEAAINTSPSGIPNSRLIESRIKSAIDAQLLKKGFTENNTSPDVLIVYHTGIQDRINVTDWGYSYGGYYGGWGGRAIDVYQYQQGTLVIDMIELSSKELVWRGWAQGTVDQRTTPDEIDYKITTAVKKVFSKYPPVK